MNEENWTGVCRDCRHFHQRPCGQVDVETLIEMEAGLCCAHAPTAGCVRGYSDEMEMQPWAQFPIVDEEMTCGEFQPRANANARNAHIRDVTRDRPWPL